MIWGYHYFRKDPLQTPRKKTTTTKKTAEVVSLWPKPWFTPPRNWTSFFPLKSDHFERKWINFQPSMFRRYNMLGGHCCFATPQPCPGFLNHQPHCNNPSKPCPLHHLAWPAKPGQKWGKRNGTSTSKVKWCVSHKHVNMIWNQNIQYINIVLSGTQICIAYIL